MEISQDIIKDLERIAAEISELWSEFVINFDFWKIEMKFTQKASDK